MSYTRDDIIKDKIAILCESQEDWDRVFEFVGGWIYTNVRSGTSDLVPELKK